MTRRNHYHVPVSKRHALFRHIEHLQKDYPVTLHTINAAADKWTLWFGDCEVPLTFFPPDCDFFACLSIIAVRRNDSGTFTLHDDATLVPRLTALTLTAENAWKEVLQYIKTKNARGLGRCMHILRRTIQLCRTCGPYVLRNRFCVVTVSDVDLQVVRSFANVLRSQLGGAVLQRTVLLPRDQPGVRGET